MQFLKNAFYLLDFLSVSRNTIVALNHVMCTHGIHMRLHTCKIYLSSMTLEKKQELSTQKRKKLLSTIRATKKWTCLKLAQEYTVPPHCEVDSKGREKRFRFSFINSCICQVLKSPVKHHLHNKLFGSAAWKKPFLSACHKMQL